LWLSPWLEELSARGLQTPVRRIIFKGCNNQFFSFLVRKFDFRESQNGIQLKI
jgi:hypothetical protein